MNSNSSSSQIAGSFSLSPSSLLPLPRSLRHNKSFVQLARFIGIAAPESEKRKDEDSDSGSDVDDNDDRSEKLDEDEDVDIVDEESLMWDAQTALIAHQPALAAKYYTAAALPPHSSASACLALGNLLSRGSSLAQPQSTDADSSAGPSRKESVDSTAMARSPQSSWFQAFFRPNSSTPPSTSPITERPPPLPRFQSNGWSLPTDGKRAVRDFEGMGKAGGWLVLGIGWVIENEIERRKSHRLLAIKHDHRSNEDVDDAIVFDSKGKGRAGSQPRSTQPQHSKDSDFHTEDINRSLTPSTSTDSFTLHTPTEEKEGAERKARIKLLYELLTPLLHLYRHGHIQMYDPVALPPIAPSQLPSVLKPQGDDQKGRNVWYLGSIVVSKILDLELLSTSDLDRDTSMKRHGALVMCHYIRGLTSLPPTAEECFQTIIDLGICGLEVPDELVRQAYRRLHVYLKGQSVSPSASERTDYPFPNVTHVGTSTQGKPIARAHHNRQRSAISIYSYAESMVGSGLPLTPAKSTISLASLACETSVVDTPSFDSNGAVKALKKVQKKISKADAGPWWPSLNTWSMTASQQNVNTGLPHDTTASRRERTPLRHEVEVSEAKAKEIGHKVLRAVASSPHLSATKMPSPPHTPNRRLPFEPVEAVASIDPELAALELASALTKKVNCSVCDAGGVNFPNCRRCGLTFCSRECRVGVSGAGDGKRHVCGLWESRRLLKVPVATIRPRSPVSSRPKVC